MIARPKILWIEDSARYELSELAGPVYYSRKYTLTLAEDASSAVHHLKNTCFDALIVDMRLPPGPNPIWLNLYQRGGKNKDKTLLGLRLLQWLFHEQYLAGSDLALLGEPPAWAHPQRVAVFTVEPHANIGRQLDQLGIHHYQQKTANRHDTILLELINQLINYTGTVQ